MDVGTWLVVGAYLAAGTVIALRMGEKGRRVEQPAIAAATAYLFYLGAALMAGAEWPEFLREHLFDGLAPAAVVGFLISFIPREQPRAALPWFRRAGLLFAGGALVFGLIAAAAVFASGSDRFAKPVEWCALWGGGVFAAAYWTGYREDVVEEPSKRAALPEPGGPEGAPQVPAAQESNGEKPA